MERSGQHLWEDVASGAILEAASCGSMAAQRSLVGIEHKPSAALFVPARALWGCLGDLGLGLAGPGPVDAAAAGLKKQRSKRTRR